MALEGTLQDMKLVDLFEIFKISNKSGILRIFAPSKECAVYVTMGRLIDATVYDTLTRQLLITADDAVLQILQWDVADFIFTHDPSTVRHPVTIYHESDQLVRLSAELPTPTLPVARLPYMMMPISESLAFSHDIDLATYTMDRQIRRRTLFAADTTRVHTQTLPPQVCGLDLVPFAGEAQYVRPTRSAMAALPVLYERVAGEECVTARVPQAPQPRHAAVSLAGRNLLAAVMRHVHEL